MLKIKKGLLESAHINLSPNCDERADETDLSLIVIHNISLPPNEFGGAGIDQLFTNTLDKHEHPFYEEIYELRVSSHLLIRRDGEVVQYVPFHQRAWHAGVSQFLGRNVCNDFSIGIEMEGSDFVPFTKVQYEVLEEVLKALLAHYPNLSADAITGHEHIASGRKTDPGPYFDWDKLSSALDAKLPARCDHDNSRTVIDLLRHGEPEGGRMYRGGGTDHPLSETGWLQMRSSIDKRTKKGDADWQAIISSPMLRCKVFSEQLADEKNIPIQILENLREAGYGSWEGRTPANIREESEDEYWRFFADPVTCRPMNSEPLESFTSRINKVLEQVVMEYDGKHILLVSHLAVTRAIIGSILGMPLASQQRIDMPFAGMIRIIKDRKGLRLALI